VASIATPLVIGYIVSELHSFNGALIFVGGSALRMMVCYRFGGGDIKRIVWNCRSKQRLTQGKNHG